VVEIGVVTSDIFIVVVDPDTIETGVDSIGTNVSVPGERPSSGLFIGDGGDDDDTDDDNRVDDEDDGGGGGGGDNGMDEDEDAEMVDFWEFISDTDELDGDSVDDKNIDEVDVDCVFFSISGIIVVFKIPEFSVGLSSSPCSLNSSIIVRPYTRKRLTGQ